MAGSPRTKYLDLYGGARSQWCRTPFHVPTSFTKPYWGFGMLLTRSWTTERVLWSVCVSFQGKISTAVKSNALAELMKRTSKIHWKNLSLTLNGRNSETKNDKNNPKVPKFSSCRGLSSTLSRKCGSTTLCGCLWVFCGCLWVFLGVCGC